MDAGSCREEDNIPTDSPDDKLPDAPDPDTIESQGSPISESSVEDITVPRPKRRLTEEPCGSRYEELVLEIDKAKQNFTEYLIQEAEIVTETKRSSQIVDEIFASESPVSVDCEGVNLGDKQSGSVTLVQVGTMDGRVYLFDVLANPGISTDLKRVLESEDIVKVMHDCKADSQGLHNQFKIKLCNVFDTQSAHLVIKLSSKEYTPSDKNIGLDTICRIYGGCPNPFKDTVKGVYKKNNRFWATRPLTDLMISYAASDVLCLVPGVYNEMDRLICSETDKSHFQELCSRQLNPVVERNPGKNATKPPYRKSRGRPNRNYVNGANNGNAGYYHGAGPSQPPVSHHQQQAWTQYGQNPDNSHMNNFNNHNHNHNQFYNRRNPYYRSERRNNTGEYFF